MSSLSKKILILGLFLSDKNRHKVNRSAADQLAELLLKNGYGIITTSNKVNRVARFLDTIFTILTKSSTYKIAIVPLYGTTFSYWWAYASCLALKATNKKIVIIIHGGSIPDRMKTNASKFLRVIKLADRVVCPSPYILQILNQFNVESILVENVVNLKEYQFHLKERFRPRILWMRTLHEIYNPEMAVRVASILSVRYKDVRMVIAGRDDGTLKLVEDLSKQLKVEDIVELPGYINNKEKNKYASNLDVYICTNRIDNAPVSFIEMMALGLPIVSVKVGGIPYLLQHEENGLMVELDDDIAMADYISAIIDQPALGKTLVRNGLAFSKQFGEEPVLKKWKALLQNLQHQLN